MGLRLFQTTSFASPDLESVAFDDASDLWDVITKAPNDGSMIWARVTSGGIAPTPNGAGGWSGTALETGTIPVGPAGDPVDIPETGTTGSAYDLYLYQRTAAGEDSAVISTSYIADNTAPVISAIASASNTEVNVVATTDHSDGTVYAVATLSAIAPTAAQIKAGQDHTGGPAASARSKPVTAPGTQPPLILSGLANGTLYHFHTVHADAHRNASNIDSDTATPTSAVGPQASFVYGASQEATDQVLTVDLSHESLSVGDTVVLALYVAAQTADITAVGLEGNAGTLLGQSTATTSTGKCQFWQIIVPAAAAGNAAALLALTRSTSAITVIPAFYRVAGAINASVVGYQQDSDGIAGFNLNTGPGSVISAGRAYADSSPTWTAGATDDHISPDASATRFGSAITTAAEARAMEFQQSDQAGGLHGAAIALT